MSSTAHSRPEEYIEHVDPPHVLEAKVDRLVTWIRASNHFIAFTGAGISTACGIPDFRSGMNTILQTGPGCWTVRAEIEKAGKDEQKRRAAVNRAAAPRKVRNCTTKAIPSFSHRALVQLQHQGYLKHLISQNTDGLHRRSGFPPTHLSELHGNSNLEICDTCGQQYLRDFKCRRRGNRVHGHETGRMCVKSGCDGKLNDSIINFGENLPEKPLHDGFWHAASADLCLSLGSSLRVTPAADMPLQVGESDTGHLVIVNLQSTPLDDVADLRINGKIDDVMQLVMQKLELLPVPEFRLRRYAKFKIYAKPPKPSTDTADSSGQHSIKDTVISVKGVDVDGLPFSLFTKVDVTLQVGKQNGQHKSKLHSVSSTKEPHRIRIPAAVITECMSAPTNSTNTVLKQVSGNAIEAAPTEADAVADAVAVEPDTDCDAKTVPSADADADAKQQQYTMASVTLHFAGHYKEPPVCVQVPVDRYGTIAVRLTYNPFNGEWKSNVQATDFPYDPANVITEAQDT
jgi:NAD-dependent SIR2 family protein deacetylase